MVVPARSTVPVTPSRMPMIDSTSSAWPLPSTPAMPSTSPLWMSKLMSSSSGREPTPGRLRFLTDRSTLSVTVDVSVLGDGSSEPTMQLGELP